MAFNEFSPYRHSTTGSVGTVPFEAPTLQAQIRTSYETGVGNSVSVTTVFDDDGTANIDPYSDVRTSRFDLLQAALDARFEQSTVSGTPPAASVAADTAPTSVPTPDAVTSESGA